MTPRQLKKVEQEARVVFEQAAARWQDDPCDETDAVCREAHTVWWAAWNASQQAKAARAPKRAVAAY